MAGAGGGGGIMAPPLLGRETADLRENLHACQLKCIEQYDNFNFLKKIPYLHIYGNLCKYANVIKSPAGTIIRQQKFLPTDIGNLQK